ncbi:MAG: dihydropteroate synthase [Deltaproteobacteria bacterium]|nr:MAG: dihydropteroate synthase [Deltaproteobacteria bacterium]
MGEGTIFPRDRTTIVAVLNVTPDSFSDGGRFVRPDARIDIAGAVATGCARVRDGAHVIDVGGESTRPGARAVPVETEIARTVPVLEALAKHTPAPLSIDTRKAAVADAALTAGARIVNDVSGLRFDPDLADVVARHGATLILGHLRGRPETMQRDIHFDAVLPEVASELAASVETARRAGVPRERLVVDPGLGFGKTLEQNLALLAGLRWLRKQLDLPVLVGPSRKSFLGALTGDPVEAREPATLAACAVAVFLGADAVRVHEAAGAVRVAAVCRALRRAHDEVPAS